MFVGEVELRLKQRRTDFVSEREVVRRNPCQGDYTSTYERAMRLFACLGLV